MYPEYDDGLTIAVTGAEELFLCTYDVAEVEGWEVVEAEIEVEGKVIWLKLVPGAVTGSVLRWAVV